MKIHEDPELHAATTPENPDIQQIETVCSQFGLQEVDDSGRHLL